MLARAIQYATEMHGTQMRKYEQGLFIQHPLKVMHYVTSDLVYGGDEIAACIAILHDVEEDCSSDDTDEGREHISYAIKNLFNDEIAKGVHHLTNEYTKLRYPELNRAERKEKELQRLILLPDREKTIKLYDRQSNLEGVIGAQGAARKYSRLFARESFNLARALAMPSNAHISGQVILMAGQLQEAVK